MNYEKLDKKQLIKKSKEKDVDEEITDLVIFGSMMYFAYKLLK